MLLFKIDNTAQIKPERESQFCLPQNHQKKKKSQQIVVVGSISQVEKKIQLVNQDTLVGTSHCSILEFFLEVETKKKKSSFT